MNEEYVVEVEEVSSDELFYLQSISEDIHAIRLLYEEQIVQEQENAAQVAEEVQEPVETPAPEQTSDTADTDQQLELMEAIQASVSGIETKVESIDLDSYESTINSFKQSAGDILSSSEQSNTYLVVACFGVFLVLGILLAKLCWSRFLGDRDG